MAEDASYETATPSRLEGEGRRSFIKRVLYGAVVAGAVPVAPEATQSASMGRLDHVSVPIRNVTAMTSFYRALGFEVREGDALISVHFRDQKINFHRPSLWQQDSFTLRAPAARPPCGDFCWVWEGTEESLRETLATAGAEILAEGEREGGRDGGNAVGQSLYTRDPDGNLLEFIRY